MSPRSSRERGRKGSEEIMAKNFSHLKKNFEPQIKEAENNNNKQKNLWVGKTQREFYLDPLTVITDESRCSSKAKEKISRTAEENHIWETNVIWLTVNLYKTMEARRWGNDTF